MITSHPSDPSKKSLVDGARLTCFSNDEEAPLPTNKPGIMPVFVETELVRKGAKFERVEVMGKGKVVWDKPILTGESSFINIPAL